MPEIVNYLISQFGPTGAVLGVGYYLVRALLPTVTHWLDGQLQVQRELVASIREIRLEMATIRSDVDDIKDTLRMERRPGVGPVATPRTVEPTP